jgi:hypothetical protein
MNYVSSLILSCGKGKKDHIFKFTNKISKDHKFLAVIYI